MILVTLYTRKDCALCDEVQAGLEKLNKQYPHRLTIIDIDSSPGLKKQYKDIIPVVEIGALVLKAPITQDELRLALISAATQDQTEAAQAKSQTAPAEITTTAQPSTSQYNTSNKWTTSDSITYWFSRHYLAVLNTIIGIFVFLPFLAPVLLKAGLVWPSAVIYRVYSVTCHQLAYRSFFLFGEQPVYPRAAAHMNGLISFQQATGINEDNNETDILAARLFTGSPAVGYKVAICERDIAIYGSILLFGLLYAATGRRFKPLPWYLWLLIGLGPIALDGFSQLLSQPPFNFIPYRESTPYLRVLTGFLFGFMTAWFGFPTIEQSMCETREMMENKWQKTHPTLPATSKSGVVS